jgi:hypothetical protein
MQKTQTISTYMPSCILVLLFCVQANTMMYTSGTVAEDAPPAKRLCMTEVIHPVCLGGSAFCLHACALQWQSNSSCMLAGQTHSLTRLDGRHSHPKCSSIIPTNSQALVHGILLEEGEPFDFFGNTSMLSSCDLL